MTNITKMETIEGELGRFMLNQGEEPEANAAMTIAQTVALWALGIPPSPHILSLIHI